MPIPLLVLALYAVKKIYDANNRSSTTVSPPPEIVIDKNICFAGRTSSGKSSTANALAGYSAFLTGEGHGTTTSSKRIDFERNYKIIDTPGLLDTHNYEFQVLYEARRSEIIVYVTPGQLFDGELVFVRKLQREMRYNQKLLLFVNKQDIRENTLSSSQRETERLSIISQVSGTIAAENIVFGSAAPVYQQEEQAPKIDQLKLLIYKTMKP